jgi:hypothetical protein
MNVRSKLKKRGQSASGYDQSACWAKGGSEMGRTRGIGEGRNTNGMQRQEKLFTV